jgi:hypothetical protein
MIRKVCNVNPADVCKVVSSELLAQLGLMDLELVLRERRLRWYGHVERSSGAIKNARDIIVTGRRGRGRPKLTWSELTEKDRREWKLSGTNPLERDSWRAGVRTAMRAASQISGRGTIDMVITPAPAR